MSAEDVVVYRRTAPGPGKEFMAYNVFRGQRVPVYFEHDTEAEAVAAARNFLAEERRKEAEKIAARDARAKARAR